MRDKPGHLFGKAYLGTLDFGILQIQLFQKIIKARNCAFGIADFQRFVRA